MVRVWPGWFMASMAWLITRLTLHSIILALPAIVVHALDALAGLALLSLIGLLVLNPSYIWECGVAPTMHALLAPIRFLYHLFNPD